MVANDSGCVTIKLAVMVQVDPTDDELLDRFDDSHGSFSITDVVRSEIESNLESVSYVRHVSIECIKEVRR